MEMDANAIIYSYDVHWVWSPCGSNCEHVVVGTLGYLLVEGEHMRCLWFLDVQLDYLMVGDVRMGYKLVGSL